MALQLKRRGLERVRPLEGGLDAWRERGLPLEGARAAEGAAPEASLPASLGAVEVVAPDGNRRRLAELWSERPAVLVFVRHFGCMLCRETALRLQERLAEVRAAGAELVAVGNGSPDAAGRFREAFGLAYPVYVDEARDAYRLLGLRRDVGGTTRPAVAWAILRAWRRGARQGRLEGDPWQLGGVVVVRPGGAVAFQHASRHAGDPPPLDAVLETLRALRR